MQHQNPRNAAFTQPQAGPGHAGHRLQTGAWTPGKYVTATALHFYCRISLETAQEKVSPGFIFSLLTGLNTYENRCVVLLFVFEQVKTKE